jgi:hypothetical protein
MFALSKQICFSISWLVSSVTKLIIMLAQRTICNSGSNLSGFFGGFQIC